MKRLICGKEVEEANKAGLKTICIEEGTIITPSAKDMAQIYGIEFQTGACQNEAPTNCCTGGSGINSELIYQALTAMMDKAGLAELLAGLVKDVPYISESDSEGLVKLVRGNTAKWEALDTGNPNDKVFYNEVVGAGDGSSVNLGFMTIENCNFPWETACEEFFYVIEGTMTVSTQTKSFKANAGDVLSFKKGAQLTFGSPDKTKVFYATH